MIVDVYNDGIKVSLQELSTCYRRLDSEHSRLTLSKLYYEEFYDKLQCARLELKDVIIIRYRDYFRSYKTFNLKIKNYQNSFWCHWGKTYPKPFWKKTTKSMVPHREIVKVQLRAALTLRIHFPVMK